MGEEGCWVEVAPDLHGSTVSGERGREGGSG